MIDPSAILSMLVSFMSMIDTSSLRRHIFFSGASRYCLVAQLVGRSMRSTARSPAYAKRSRSTESTMCWQSRPIHESGPSDPRSKRHKSKLGDDHDELHGWRKEPRKPAWSPKGSPIFRRGHGNAWQWSREKKAPSTITGH